MQIFHGVTENRFSISRKKMLACCHLGKFLNYFCFICHIKLQFNIFPFYSVLANFFGIGILQESSKILKIH